MVHQIDVFLEYEIFVLLSFSDCFDASSTVAHSSLYLPYLYYYDSDWNWNTYALYMEDPWYLLNSASFKLNMDKRLHPK